MKRLELVLFTVLVVISASLPFSAASNERDESQRRLPIKPLKLEQAILESPERKNFDSQKWKVAVGSRQAMLLSLFRSDFFNKKRDEVIRLLGEPLKSNMRVGQSSDYFDLGKYQGENIVLMIPYSKEKPATLVILQQCDSGYLYFLPGSWYWKNPDDKDAAKDFNYAHLLVGTPTQHLCQVMGHPQKQGNIWKSGTYEMEYTPDGNKVRKFRMSADQRAVNTTTDWETTDLRSVAGSYCNALDIHRRGETIDAMPTKPLMKFDRARWDKVWNRAFMLFDITHSFRLIGKQRSAIRDYLGEPYLSERKIPPEYNEAKFVTRFAQHKPYTKFDWYALCGTGCVWPADPGLYLEIVYRDDSGREIAAGYRIIESDVYRDGQKEFPGTYFTASDGICQPVENQRRDK